MQLEPGGTGSLHPLPSYSEPTDIAAHGKMRLHVGQAISGDGGVVSLDSTLGQVNVVGFPRYPFAHDTEHDNPRGTSEHAEMSKAGLGADSAEHSVMAVHKGRLPEGSVCAATLSLGQVYVDAAVPV